MIMVTAEYRTKPGKREQVCELAKAVMAESRKEEGCYFYTVFASIEDENGLICVERWESKAHLDAHGKTPHYAAFQEGRKDLIDKESFRINVYELK